MTFGSQRRPYAPATHAISGVRRASLTAASSAAKMGVSARLYVPATICVAVGIAATTTMSRTPSKPKSDPYQARNNALLEAYGDGTSMEDLEKAMKHYEGH
ncbi:hypothetical protein LTS18_005735 [Coniosporium uncinatum]|uniref:Uncharacterized protein n=1 Tax=Coniosporium uncinatum TaxID=93489 RepID=A0ACC3DBG9_9PEZI|nr:hypothetical protein LTS18_005735 [Coniosporium uncinatum]